MNFMPVINMTATGMNIARLRKNAGMTVRDLQAIFGFANPQAIYKWQRGETMPTLDNMIVLAAVFNVTVDEILVLEERFQIRIIA
jgi:transcriptional regulator with XRE-family HTH domain